jgi:hypothetical protein
MGGYGNMGGFSGMGGNGQNFKFTMNGQDMGGMGMDPSSIFSMFMGGGRGGFGPNTRSKSGNKNSGGQSQGGKSKGFSGFGGFDGFDFDDIGSFGGQKFKQQK